MLGDLILRAAAVGADMARDDLTKRPAVELARLIRDRTVSPVEVLDAHLDAIARINPQLNAIVTLADNSARAAAKQAEQRLQKGESPGCWKAFRS
jgi:amidase